MLLFTVSLIYCLCGMCPIAISDLPFLKRKMEKLLQEVFKITGGIIQLY